MGQRLVARLLRQLGDERGELPAASAPRHLRLGSLQCTYVPRRRSKTKSTAWPTVSIFDASSSDISIP